MDSWKAGLLLSVFVTLAATGCGGGGGNNDSDSNNDDGGTTNSSVTHTTFDGGNTASASISSDNAVKLSATVFLAGNAADNAGNQWTSNKPGRAARATSDMSSTMCPGGGSASYSIVESTQIDTAQYTFNNCVYTYSGTTTSYSVTYNGSMYWESENTDTYMSLALTYDNFTVTYGDGTSTTLDGTWSMECTGLGTQNQSCSYSKVYDYGGTKVSVGNDWSISRDSQGRPTSVSGEICEYSEGCVTYTTTSDFTYTAGCMSGMPSGGAFEVRPSDSTDIAYVQVTFNSDCTADYTGQDSNGAAFSGTLTGTDWGG